MKKTIFFLLILIIPALSQVRFLNYSGVTDTLIQTIDLDFYCWEFTIINDGAVTDTLWFWTESVPASQNRKIFLLGGEFINLKLNSSVNRIYLQGSTSGIKRRVIAKP